MLYYAVVVCQMNATKGWNLKKVVIEHATKRLGKDEKIQIIYVRIKSIAMWIV